jgi:hypothetical protein
MAAPVSMGTTIRVSDETRKGLRELEEMTGLGPQELVAKAVEAYRRHTIIEQSNEAYARARAAGDTFEDMLEWEVANLDGLEDEDWSQHLPDEPS